MKDKKNDNFYYILAKNSIYPALFIIVFLSIFFLYKDKNYNSNINTSNKNEYLSTSGAIKITQSEANSVRNSEMKTLVYVKNKKLNVYIAKSQYDQDVGLMEDTNLKINQGMLFIFSNYKKHPFWMANTLIPLDMLFISKNMAIISIMKAIPCKSDKCLIYNPNHYSMYVLEVNPRYVLENNIKIGDKVMVKNF
jgi:uncharacterized membrane protein (UPF0127 family)